MPLNQSSIFPPSREILINFNWTDLSSATGYVVYDGWGTDTSTGMIYNLLPSGNASSLSTPVSTGTDKVSTSPPSTSNTYVKLLDLDFDTTEFQLTRNIEGTAIVRIGGFMNEIGSGTGFDSYIILKLRKWDGASETEIASVQSATQSIDNDQEYSFTLPITVPLTKLKKGEFLRLTTEYWGRSTSSTEFTLRFYHDPGDDVQSGSSAGNTRLVLAIPYKINV
jgi:hypothetical protein